MHKVQDILNANRVSGLFVILVLAAFALLPVAMQTKASEIEPRSYVNTPVGVNFLLIGYGDSYGDISIEGSPPIRDARLTIHSAALSYVRSLDVWGKSAKFDVILPYSDLSGSAKVGGVPLRRDVSGFNDLRMRFSINFYGAPALSPQEFANYQQDLIFGASVQVSAPTGQYDDDKLVNIGNNRWFVKPNVGASKAWGPFALELSSGFFFFSKNDDYLNGKTLEQNPLSSTQLHATYYFKNGVWVAMSGTYDCGGRLIVNGVRRDNVQNNLRVGGTFALPVTRNNSLKLYASDDVRTSKGTIDFYLFGIVWQYRWGQGI